MAIFLESIPRLYTLHFTLYTLHPILLAHWAHGLTSDTIVVVPAHAAYIEVQAARAVRDVRVERT